MIHRAAKLALVATFAITGCGLPSPPNIRQEFSKGIQPLGVVPMYPLNETARLGQLYLGDAATVAEGDSVPFVPTNVRVTDAAVPFMEVQRSALMAEKNRYPCSSDKLGDQISLTDQSRSYYLQTTCNSGGVGSAAPTAAATPSVAGKTFNIDMGAVPQPAKAVAKSRAPAPNGNGNAAPHSLAPLELAGLPSYSLASITNTSLAGGAPSGFASFLAAVGLRRTASLTVEAEGVEIASLPADAYAAALTAACKDANTPFGNIQLGRATLNFADYEMQDNAETRAKYSKSGTRSYEPRLIMLRRIFYLRGIRYIFNDTRAYSAMLEAAANVGSSSAAQVPIPNISMNVVTPSSAATNGNDRTSAQLSALQSQLDGLRTAISSGSSAQIAGSFSRATSRGIEFVDLFQRPLAFGYAPLSIPFDKVRGLSGYCAVARGEQPFPVKKEN